MNNKFTLILKLSGTVFAALIIIVFVLNHFHIISIQDFLYPGFSTSNKSVEQKESLVADNIIAKVGEENIYQKDLNQEIKTYPLSGSQNISKHLLKKIIKDSIMLQSAQKEKFIKLDESVFNSQNKDYVKRIKYINDIRKIIENRQDTISGKVISLWFYNLKPGSVGYEKGKEIAFNKIQNLHNKVTSKEITIEQAGQLIMDDPSLKQVDDSYKSNAILPFKANRQDTITFDRVFDDKIRQLTFGQITEIFLAKDKKANTDQMIDAVYMFAQVDEGQTSSNALSFDQWYAQIEKKYEVILY